MRDQGCRGHARHDRHAGAYPACASGAGCDLQSGDWPAHISLSTSVVATTVVAGPIMFADGESVPGKTLTEYISLRPLLDRLYLPARSPAEDGNESTRRNYPKNRRFDNCDCRPASWRDYAGGIEPAYGRLHQLETVLVVTQTPENLGKIHKLLETLLTREPCRSFAGVDRGSLFAID